MNDSAKLRVLVVDDEADVRTMLHGFFEGHGCDVVSATTADEALVAIGRQPFDAVVTDVHMDPHDGVWLWRHAVTHRPALTGRFLFISGYVFDTRENGVLGERFLAKPFTISQLWAAVTSIAAPPRAS